MPIPPLELLDGPLVDRFFFRAQLIALEETGEFFVQARIIWIAVQLLPPDRERRGKLTQRHKPGDVTIQDALIFRRTYALGDGGILLDGKGLSLRLRNTPSPGASRRRVALLFLGLSTFSGCQFRGLRAGRLLIKAFAEGHALGLACQLLQQRI